MFHYIGDVAVIRYPGVRRPSKRDNHVGYDGFALTENQ